MSTALSTRIVGPSSRAPGAARVGTVSRERPELVACQHCGATTLKEIVDADAHGRRYLFIADADKWVTVNCAGRVCP